MTGPNLTAIEGPDEWRTLHQVLPILIYDKLIVHLARLGQANGVSIQGFLEDEKSRQMVGPRVLVYELLAELLSRIETKDLQV